MIGRQPLLGILYISQEENSMLKKFMILILIAGAIVLIPAGFAASAGEGSCVPTEEWVPPVIDENDALENSPWLLVLKIAQEEIGYVEGPGNKSKYGKWFGDEYAAWCAEFLSWCVNEADTRYGTSLMNNVFPHYGHPKDGAPWFLQRERFISSKSRVPGTEERMWLIGADDWLKSGEYIPSPGDYMWFSYYNPKKGTDHVAIVEGVSQNADGSLVIHVIEGNNPDRVQRNTYDIGWKQIYGYGTPVRKATRSLRLCSHGDDCQPVNRYLHLLGYMPEGSYAREITEKTIQALKAYQKDNGLRQTCQVDMETRALMEQDPAFTELIRNSQR